MATNTANTIGCPHCGAANAYGSAFCEACGKALPSAVAGGPRVVSSAQFATTSAGQKLQGDELQKTAKKAAGALLAVAIIQTVLGGITYAILRNAPRIAAVNTTLLFGTVFGIAAIFWALYIWARRSPFPAAIAGLVIYVTLWLIDLVVWLGTVGNSRTGSGPANVGPFNGIIMKIIIIAVLVNAIKAGLRHRELQRQQAGGFPVI